MLRLRTHFVVLALVALAAGAGAQTTTSQPAQTTTYQPRFPGDPARSESEFEAIAYMKTVLNAEREYEKKHHHYAPSLLALAGGARSFTKRMARTDRGDYTVHYRGGADKFSVELTPKQFDQRHRSFYVDNRGIFRAEEDHPANAESPLLKDTRAG